MKEIQKVLICGIGAVGTIYANKINEYDSKNLKILVDKNRLEKYTKNPKIFNGKPLKFEYILPDDTTYKADLIIIATKFDGLNNAIKNIENFVKDDTIIISLLNGVTSEEIIAKKYGWKHILLSYFIGHSAMRDGNIITHDGVGDIVFGIKDKNLTDEADFEAVKKFFDKVGIKYKTPDNMLRSYWLKFMFNVAVNQSSAILRMTFGQMKNNEKYMEFVRKVMKEVEMIAKASGVEETETMIQDALLGFEKMMPEGKTSMFQDIEAGRKTEVDMFAGTIIELGKKYNIPTPYNMVLKSLINIIEI